MFSDPWNPSSTEVCAWAYDAAAEEPCQDWDLALSWAGHERDYLSFVADQNCPKRFYFLSILYLMIGDAVRSGFRVASESSVRGFLKLAENHSNQAVRRWHQRSLRLLKHPNEFDYEAWCGGGIARNDA
jgi:hypothetical protein